MRKLGRCGRQRRKNHQDSQHRGISQAQLSENVRLQQWMRTHVSNCGWSLLKPADFKGTGRGLSATRKICPGETIISISIQLLITTDTAFNSDIGSLIIREEQQFTPQQLLALFLVIEHNQGESSPWFPYIATLPLEYSTPLYFSHSEIELLTPQAKELAKSSRDRFAAAFERISKFIRNSAPSYQHMFNESDVRWAWSTVNTRSVYLHTAPHPLLIIDPEESHVALAPFLDLLNHTDAAQMSAGFNSNSGCYEIVTQDTFRKNEQVFICYGAHDNVKLLIDYGFTLPNNYNNNFVFTFDDLIACLADKTQHVDRKIAIIKNNYQLHKNLICTMDGVSWSLMTALRVAALSWEDLSSWRLLLQDKSISPVADELAFQMAIQLVKSALWKAKRHLKLVEQQPGSTHSDSLKNLAQEDVKILETSLTSLNDR